METCRLDFKLSNLGTALLRSSFGDKVDYFVKYYSYNPDYRLKAVLVSYLFSSHFSHTISTYIFWVLALQSSLD